MGIWAKGEKGSSYILTKRNLFLFCLFEKTRKVVNFLTLGAAFGQNKGTMGDLLKPPPNWALAERKKTLGIDED